MQSYSHEFRGMLKEGAVLLPHLENGKLAKYEQDPTKVIMCHPEAESRMRSGALEFKESGEGNTLKFSQFPFDVWQKTINQIKTASSTNYGNVYNGLLAAGNINIDPMYWDTMEYKQTKVSEAGADFANGNTALTSMDFDIDRAMASIDYTQDSSKSPIMSRAVRLKIRGSTLQSDDTAVTQVGKLIVKQRELNLLNGFSSLHLGLKNGTGTDPLVAGSGPATALTSWSASNLQVQATMNFITCRFLTEWGKSGPLTVFLANDLWCILKERLSGITDGVNFTALDSAKSDTDIGQIIYSRNLAPGELIAVTSDQMDLSWQATEINMSEFAPYLHQQNVVVLWAGGTLMNFEDYEGGKNVIYLTNLS